MPTRRTFAVIAATLWFPALAWAANDAPKRGFAGSDTDKIVATNSSWFYGWGLNLNTTPNSSAERVPMFWGNFGINTTNINNVIASGATYVLGFNEPERADQANMSVATAINKWTTLQALSTAGIKMVSPAVSDTTDGRAWITDFMNQAAANNLVVDEVAFHWYGASTPNNPTGAANNMLNRVDWYHNTFGLPVWVTEFGIIDWGGNYTEAEMQEANRIFYQTVQAGLDARSYVTRYAPFQWNNDTRIVNGDPELPTTAGEGWIHTIYDTGETKNINGQSQGDDYFYLRGGTITNTGSSQINALRFLDAVENTSTITGAARWDVRNGGAVRVRAGATLNKTGANQVSWNDVTLIVNGDVNINDGKLQIEKDVTSTGSGAFTVNAGGTLGFWAPVGETGVDLTNDVTINGGDVELALGAHTISGGVSMVFQNLTLHGDGDLTLSGALTGVGSIDKHGAGVLRLTGANTFVGNTIVRAGTLHADNAAASPTHDGKVIVFDGASLIGDSLIAGDVQMDGALSAGVGNSVAGTIQIDGDLTLSATAVVDFDGNSFLGVDQIHVGGDATLAGAFQIDTFGFDPGTVRTAMTAGQFIGVFDNALVTGYEIDAGHAIAVLYEDSDDPDALPDTLRLVWTAKGDANGDGAVSLLDLNALGANFGAADARWQYGDFNYDGEVSLLDLNTLGAHFGATAPIGGVFAPSVPEPAALALLLLGAPTLLRRRR